MDTLHGDNLYDQRWREQAACRMVDDPDIFFAEASDIRRERAITMCGSCTVRLACLEYATAHKEKAGIWGGQEFKPRAGSVTELHADAQQLEDIQVVLSEREFAVLQLRFGLAGAVSHKASEIAGLLGVTPERVAQIIGRSLTKIRHTPSLIGVIDA